MGIWMRMEHLAAAVVDRLQLKLVRLKQVLFYPGHHSW